MREWLILLAAAAAAAAALPGCVPATDDAAGRSTSSLEVFDGFEHDTRWVVDSADDPARLTRSTAKATEGKRSLRVEFEAGEKRKVLVRRDVSLDLSDAASVAFDVSTGNEGVMVAVAFVTDPGGVYFESSPAAIPPKKKTSSAKPGTAKDTASAGGPEPARWYTVRFRLDGPKFKCADTNWQPRSHLANAEKTERVIFVVYTGTDEKGEVLIDNLRFDRPPETIMSAVRPRILAVKPVGAVARQWGRYDVSVEFEASYASPFDPYELSVYADFRAPSGEVHRVPGFLDAGGFWRGRYMPLERGAYAYHVGVRNAVGSATSAPRRFVVNASSPPAPVGISARDPRHFELATGEPFYPVGMNVAWAGDFEPFFKGFAGAGGNTVRIWLAPWSLGVASRTVAGEIDLEKADRLERVLDLAARYGLRVQLVLAYHGEFDRAWKESPYAAMNGGPCAVPGEFFTDSRARAAFRGLLRYVAARYASHKAIFAWELMNEADLVPALSTKDVVYWHREMARVLRYYDPVEHPITTSVSRVGALAELEELKGIDFLQVHAYGRKVDAAILDQVAAHARAQRPSYIGEFAGSFRAAPDQSDTNGVRLRAGLWLSLASPASGTAMPWWWDTHIDGNGLYRHWKAVSSLARKVDRVGKRWRFVNEALASSVEGAPRGARVQGILTRTEGLLYLYDPQVLADTTRVPYVLPQGGTMILEGLVDGEYTVEIWDGSDVIPSRRASARASGGKLPVTLPRSRADFAVYFRAKRAAEPGLRRHDRDARR